MPKQIMDYSKTIIYKIVCKDININDSYVGHTTNFTKRKNQHKNTCINENSKDYNIYVYQFIRNNGGWGNFDMIEIEKYKCNDKLEACKRERYWIENLKASLNKVIPSRTQKEYREENKDSLSERKKKNYLENKNAILEKNKERYNQNKIVYNKNRRERYNINKNKISANNKIKVHCDICNCDIVKNTVVRHNKSAKHQNNLNK
jgi:hypothetical protein